MTSARLQVSAFAAFSAALMLSTSAYADLSTSVSGRLDFTAVVGDSFADFPTGTADNGNTFTAVNSGLAAGSGTGALDWASGATNISVYSNDVELDNDLDFDMEGRIDFNVKQSGHFYDYGGFARLDIDADAGTVSDTDAHIFIQTSFGKARFGTDIDGYQGAFDTDILSAGPITPISSVHLPIAQHAFDTDLNDETSVTLTTSSYSGLTLAGEVDEDGDLGGSIKYVGNSGLVGLEGVVAVSGDDAFAARGKATYGNTSLALFGGSDDDDEQYYGGGVGYKFGGLNLSVDGAIADAEWVDGADRLDAKDKSIALGAGFDLAPGLKVAASLGYFDREVTSTVGTTVTQEVDQDHVRGAGRLRLEF